MIEVIAVDQPVTITLPALHSCTDHYTIQGIKGAEYLIDGHKVTLDGTQQPVSDLLPRPVLVEG